MKRCARCEPILSKKLKPCTSPFGIPFSNTDATFHRACTTPVNIYLCFAIDRIDVGNIGTHTNTISVQPYYIQALLLKQWPG